MKLEGSWVREFVRLANDFRTHELPNSQTFL